MKEVQKTLGSSILVGVISDTHGFLSIEAVQALQGVDQIIHAGDVDELDVLEQLAEIAPVSAVRGNMDRGSGLDALPLSLLTQVGGVFVYTIHDLAHLDINPAAAGFQVVVYGHYHRPELRERSGVIYLNPGSASFPRMGSKKSLAFLKINQGRIEVVHQNLD